MQKLSVTVYKRKSRKFWTARWVDPLTGKRHERSTKATTEREALQFAVDLEQQLNTGGGHGPLAWSEFRLAYFREKVANLRPASKEKICASFNVIEDLMQPAWANFTSRDVGRLAARLREPYTGQDGKTQRTRSAATVRGHLVNLQTALRWAHRQKLISWLPDFNLPGKIEAARGRPITAEEFERLLDACPDVVGAVAADSWQWLLRGLWWSGLRLGEAIKLAWDDRGSGFIADIDGVEQGRAWFHIAAAAEKGNQNRLLPMAPEFAHLLAEVPPRQRRGHVFRPLYRNGELTGRRRDWVGRIVREIGAKAAVVTKTDEDGTRHTATAHDLRRSFGDRWAQRILPQHLQILMRHQDIKTTMKYYATRNAAPAAAAAWQAWQRDQAGKPETEKEPEM